MSSPTATPPKVAQTASDRRFGQLLAAQEGTNSLALGAMLVGLGLGSLVLGILAVAWGTSINGPRILGLLALMLGCVGFPALTGFGALTLARGSQSYYLYEGGLVRTWNGQPRAVPWQEIQLVSRRRVGPQLAESIRRMNEPLQWVTAETVNGYDLRPARGGKLRLELGVHDEGYPLFCERLERLASQGGAAITG